ncbi:MAG: ornithine cyclodeaminase [Myxococcales bacterium]|nr:ornithine cyclodeaminase [Myxococcales bacterium]
MTARGQSRMKTRLLSRHDIATILHQVGRDVLMDALIAALTGAFTSYDSRIVEVRKRDGFNYDRRRGGGGAAISQELAGGLLEWMPVLDLGSTSTVKMVSYNPKNPIRHGIPTIIATIFQHDIRTGHLLAISDGLFLTALRTGAASAIATRILAHPDARTVGIVGCGAQAVTQLHALSRVMKIDKVYVHDIAPEAARSFAKRVDFLGFDVSVVEVATLERSVDVLITATSVALGQGPVFPGDELRPHLHINAIGADVPGKTECPAAVVEAAALVCPDFRAQAVVEGECQQLPEDRIGPSLAQLVKESERYQEYRSRLTIFDSTGFALEDKVAMELFLGYADKLGLGSDVEIEAMPLDPLDPYSIESVAAELVESPARVAARK